MTGVIDVHCHFVPRDLPADPSPAGTPRWPCMACRSKTQATVMIDGRPFRELDDRSWDHARRIADMDADGVAVQALSPMPELLSYWMDAKATETLADHVNGAIAAVVAKAPGRFAGLGMVPLQAPDRAAAYLDRIRNDFGLSGVEIGSNINGAFLGEPRFDPFFAAAEELGLAVFVHALHPVATRETEVSALYVPMVAFPVDTAMTIAHLIMSGVIERFPNLRIGFSHGGGAVLPILHRLDNGWRETDGFAGTLPRPPSEYARNLYYDSLVYDGAYLRHLVDTLGADQVFVGTDYPYLIMQKDPKGFLDGALSGHDGAHAVAAGAARRFLSL